MLKKFMILYKGDATPTEQMPAEKVQEVMGAWKVWIESAGESVIDVGTPLANGEAVVDNGSAGSATQLSGYSIIQADDIERARLLVANHPFLSDKAGKFAIEIHEMLPTPGM